MRVVVTGRVGQVVSSLVERGTAAGHTVVPIGRPQLDLADPSSVSTALTEAAPDVVISAAAYTAVDKAESEAEQAYAVNAIGAGAVAEAAKKVGVPLVHISTDYVFDGSLHRPYCESDPPEPNGVYGASKLAGERAVLDAYPTNSVITRVAWVYSPFGGNFVKTMLRLANERDELGVVGDQIGNPTSALDIADGILKIAQNLKASQDSNLRGIFHMTAEGVATWADFAEAVFIASAARGGPFARVNRISTSDYPTPVIRPANSRLNCEHIEAVHGVVLPEWRNSLEVVVDRLLAAA